LSLGDDLVSHAAYKMYSAFNRRFKETGHDFDKRQRDAASERLIAMGYEGDLPFLRAQEGFDEVAAGDAQGFLSVKGDFESVPESSPNYERALVYIGRCLTGMGQLDEASAQFSSIEARAADPAFEPQNADARTRREIALAQCRYSHAELLLRDDVARPAEALAVLAGFEEQIPSQGGFHPLVRYLRVKAHALAGDVRSAEESLAVLVDSGADASSVSTAAWYTGVALEKQARQVAAGAAGDPAGVQALLKRAADAFWLHCERTGFSSFRNLRTAGDWYLEAQEPGLAQTVYEKVVDVFAGRVDVAQVDQARIGLGIALDRQRDFGRARPVWKDLLARNPKDPSVRRGAAKSFGGWLELEGDGVVEVPGSGDYAEAYQMWVDLQKAAQVTSKYHDIWWEAKLGTVYTKYRQREMDKQQLHDARELLDNLRLSTPDWDKSTIELVEPQYRYEPLYWPFFRYLDRVIPAN
jgi:tetratricopeptide (TPR) repeat protein